MDRLAMLQQMLAERPGEPFVHYGLAMELRKLGRGDEARQAFATLISEHPAYMPSYLMAGNQLVELGDKEAARVVYERGIEVARAASDEHTQGEIEAALGELEA